MSLQTGAVASNACKFSKVNMYSNLECGSQVTHKNPFLSIKMSYLANFNGALVHVGSLINVFTNGQICGM